MLAVVALLTVIHAVVLFLFYRFDNPDLFFYVRWFDLDIEKNVPSIYAAFALFVCALLFFIIAMCKRKRLDYETVCWFGLAAIFLFLSLDEGLKIHEYIGDAAETYIDATGFIYFPWVVPYGIAVILIALVYLKFILELPKSIAARFVLAGVVYLTGAVVFDMLGGRVAERNGYDAAAYCVLYTIEEFLEMAAIVFLIHALLLYIESAFGHLSISLRIEAKTEDRP